MDPSVDTFSQIQRSPKVHHDSLVEGERAVYPGRVVTCSASPGPIVYLEAPFQVTKTRSRRGSDRTSGRQWMRSLDTNIQIRPLIWKLPVPMNCQRSGLPLTKKRWHWRIPSVPMVEECAKNIAPAATDVELKPPIALQLQQRVADFSAAGTLLGKMTCY